MHIDHITKEEENRINDLLSDGIEEVRDITANHMKASTQEQLLKTSLIVNANDTKRPFQSRIQMEDIDSKHPMQCDLAPKSSALRDLINQLKKENNYILSSDEDNEKATNTGSKPQRKIKEDIEYLEESTNKFSSMKTQMNYIQSKIKRINCTVFAKKNDTRSSISLTNNTSTPIDTNRSLSYKMKNKRQLLLIDEVNRKHSANKLRTTASTSRSRANGETKRIKVKHRSIEWTRVANINVLPQKEANSDDSPIELSENDYTLKARTRYPEVRPKENQSASSALLLKSSWRRKYEDLKQKHHAQLGEIALDRKKMIQLEKTIKANSRKNLNYTTLIDYNKKLVSQDEVLVKQIAESANIRKEQSKLIRSLQREIDMLRGDINESNMNNIAEVYQAMKESLIDSHNQFQSADSQSHSQKN